MKRQGKVKWVTRDYGIIEAPEGRQVVTRLIGGSTMLMGRVFKSKEGAIKDCLHLARADKAANALLAEV